MSKFHSRGLTAAAVLAALLFGFAPNQARAAAMRLAALLFGFAPNQARAAAGDTDTQHQQTSPQGKDAPGAEDNGQPPMAQEDGVIKPPPTGDEGIHTEVP